MRIPEFLVATGTNLHQLSQASGVSYTTLHGHVKHDRPLGLDAARRLETYDARLNASELLGLAPPPKAGAHRRRAGKAA